MATARQVQLLAAAAIAVALLLVTASATEYVVGDSGGWTLNYTIGWPQNKIFQVGDTLVFKYTQGKHTVTEVDGQTFRECYRLGNKIGEWTSGNDAVALDKPGTRWFFCSVADHCELGLKLVVNVVAGAPAPGPASPAPDGDGPSPTTAPPELPPATTPPPDKLPPAAPAPATTTPPNTLPPPPPPALEKSSSAALNRYETGEAAARAMVVAGAVVAAVLM
ncbi:hypothetical protein ACP70R_015324 [Stipagrostis hirtigluma subsp. patula]